jgi:predicted  nucleic acid-binding Zn-ribbon protein
MSEQQTNNNSGLYGIIIGILLLLSGGLGYFLWQKNQTMLIEKEKQATEVKNLNLEKERISKSLDSLSNAYAGLRTENESLTSKIASTAQMVQQKEAQIKQITIQNTTDLAALRAQVADLNKTKSEMETIINVLKAENAQLKTDKTQLAGEVSNLAEELKAQIQKTQSAAFKATSFKVELLRKNKTTGKARRARDLQVSFDLVDVPQPYQGGQTLYFVVTDEKGNPIAAVNPTKKTISTPTGPIEIISIQSKQTVLMNTQRMVFNYKLEDKLKAGNYVVAIYCDKGLLGASSFRLS